MSQKLVFHQSKCICAIKRILSTTAMYVSSSSFVYLRIACYCDACLNSSALLAGATTLLNTITIQLKANSRCEAGIQSLAGCFPARYVHSGIPVMNSFSKCKVSFESSSSSCTDLACACAKCSSCSLCLVKIFWSRGITDEDILLGLLARKRRFVLYSVVGMTERKSVKCWHAIAASCRSDVFAAVFTRGALQCFKSHFSRAVVVLYTPRSSSGWRSAT